MIDKQFAEAEFYRFTESMDIETDEQMLGDADDVKSFNQTKNTIVKGIMTERVTIDDKGQPTVHVADNKDVTFYEPKGSTIMAMDSKGKDRDIAKMFASMEEMTRSARGTFGNMPMRDLKYCKALAVLFLAQ